MNHYAFNHVHANHKHDKSLTKLKNARGQIEAAIKMIEDGRYCIDISKQIMAAIAMLKNTNADILKTHMETCIKDAALSHDQIVLDKKIEELETVIDYLNKNM